MNPADDINHIFDSIDANVADQSAYNEGYQKGAQKGEFEGYHYGYHVGSKFGAEIGAYNGYVTAICSLVDKKELNLPEKTLQLIKKLELLISKVSASDLHNHQLINEIRSSFKKLQSLLKLQDIGFETDNSTF